MRLLSVVSPRMSALLEDLVTQREPGDWEMSVPVTDFYSLIWQPFQLNSHFQDSEEHPGKICLDLQEVQKPWLQCDYLDLSLEQLRDQFCGPHYQKRSESSVIQDRSWWQTGSGKYMNLGKKLENSNKQVQRCLPFCQKDHFSKAENKQTNKNAQKLTVGQSMPRSIMTNSKNNGKC